MGRFLTPWSLFFSLVLGVAAAGCASAGALRSLPLSAGEGKTYVASLDTVVGAAHRAIDSAGLNLREDSTVDSTTRLLFADKGFTPFVGGGDYVRMVIRGFAPQVVEVRVAAESKSVMDDPVHEWGTVLYRYLDAELQPGNVAAGDSATRAAAKIATLGGITPATLVRIHGPRFGTRTGRAFGVWHDQMIFGREHQDSFPVSAIDTAWVGRGHGRTGLFVGGLVGSVFTTLAVRSIRCTYGPYTGITSCRGNVTLALAGLLSLSVGAIIGSSVKTWSVRFP
ncbi:MAG TPA: hypothetical protein VF923_10465 [Gemmatimonadales bacterium]